MITSLKGYAWPLVSGRSGDLQHRVRPGLLFLAGLTLLVSCHTRFVPFQGMQIAEQNQIRLNEGGGYQGSWVSEDVIIYYRYTKRPTHLHISGTIDFTDSLKNTYTGLEHFFLWLHLIDDENKIVGFKRIDQKVLSYPIEKAPFDADIEISAGIKAITFSYSGSATENSEDGNLMMDFWKLPGDR